MNCKRENRMQKISQEARIMSWACQADIQGREIESPAMGS